MHFMKCYTHVNFNYCGLRKNIHTHTCIHCVYVRDTRPKQKRTLNSTFLVMILLMYVVEQSMTSVCCKWAFFVYFVSIFEIYCSDRTDCVFLPSLTFLCWPTKWACIAHSELLWLMTLSIITCVLNILKFQYTKNQKIFTYYVEVDVFERPCWKKLQGPLMEIT